MVNFYWTTEMLIDCGCKSSPRYECWGSKVTHKNFSCSKCEKEGRGKFNNAWRRQTNYIKNPKLMNVDEWREWLKGEGHKFLLNKEGLQKMDDFSRPKITFTTREQIEREQRKKLKLSPVETLFNNGVEVNWYGEVIRQKQIPYPEEDMTINAGTQRKCLIINKSSLKTILNIKKGNPKDYFFRSTKNKEFNPKFQDMYYAVSICRDCGKNTINGRTSEIKPGKREVTCKFCYDLLQGKIKEMRKNIHQYLKNDGRN